MKRRYEFNHGYNNIYFWEIEFQNDKLIVIESEGHVEQKNPSVNTEYFNTKEEGLNYFMTKLREVERSKYTFVKGDEIAIKAADQKLCMDMTLEELKKCYNIIAGPPYLGAFANGIWDNIPEVDTGWDQWLKHYHLELFYQNPHMRYQELRFVKNGQFAEILSFLNSLHPEVAGKAVAEMRRVVTELVSDSSGEKYRWRISEGELDDFEDTCPYPYFGTPMWDNIPGLQKYFIAWAKDKYPDIIEEIEFNFEKDDVSELEREIRNQSGSSAVIEFFDYIPQDMAKQAIAAIRSNK